MDKKEFINKKVEELNNIVNELQEMGVYILDDDRERYLTARFYHYQDNEEITFETCSTD